MSDPLAAGSVLLVGAGKMGGAMLQGWLARGWAPRLTVLDPHPGEAIRAAAAASGFRVVSDPAGLGVFETVVLAIKPQMLEAAAAALQPVCNSGTLLISILAGKTVTDLATRLPVGSVIRAMPNIAAAIGQGVTGASCGPAVTDTQRAVAAALLGAVGAVEWVSDEALIDAVTAVSGSGLAYVFLLAEVLAAAGERVGLAPEQAIRLARATVEGAGALLHAEGETPASALRRNVTSPGGTTAAALDVLMASDGLGELMTRAVLAARDRARALAG